MLGSCRATYRLAVPDNVPLEIQTSRGTVSLTGVRASVQSAPAPATIARRRVLRLPAAASSDSGDVGALSECPAERLELRSRSGDVSATVPAGRYRSTPRATRATCTSAASRDVDDARFQIQALSTSGDVTVEPPRDRSRSTSRRTCAPRGGRCSTCSSGSGRA